MAAAQMFDFGALLFVLAAVVSDLPLICTALQNT